ncbi:Global nitrogen regulator [compost metagenome]
MFPHTGQFGTNQYPATAETLINTRLLAVPIRAFEQILTTKPSIAFKMMGVMGGTIRELQNKLQGFTHRNVEDRGISLLIRLAEDFGTVLDGGDILIHVPMTHQEIANIIGFTRESVTRLLNSLCKEGILLSNRQGFIVKDLQALKERICVKENCSHCRELRLYER